MHFCMTGHYTPKSLNSIMENPRTNRFEAAKNLIESRRRIFERTPRLAVEGYRGPSGASDNLEQLNSTLVAVWIILPPA